MGAIVFCKTILNGFPSEFIEDGGRLNEQRGSYLDSIYTRSACKSTCVPPCKGISRTPVSAEGVGFNCNYHRDGKLQFPSERLFPSIATVLLHSSLYLGSIVLLLLLFLLSLL